MSEPHTTPAELAAIILAAGRSSRMGRAKALLSLPGGDTFVRRLVRTFEQAGAHPSVVVHSPEWRVSPEDASAGGARLVLNPTPERGQLSSLQCGLRAIPRTVDAALFAPVDMPLVRVETVAALMAAWRRTRADVVRPERSGRHGHPVLVSRRVIDALLAADPPDTTRTVLKRHTASTLDVPVDDEGAFLDIDTPADYERAIGWRAAPPGTRS